jgi:hypothetical protein
VENEDDSYSPKPKIVRKNSQSHWDEIIRNGCNQGFTFSDANSDDLNFKDNEADGEGIYDYFLDTMGKNASPRSPKLDLVNSTF